MTDKYIRVNLPLNDARDGNVLFPHQQDIEWDLEEYRNQYEQPESGNLQLTYTIRVDDNQTTVNLMDHPDISVNIKSPTGNTAFVNLKYFERALQTVCNNGRCVSPEGYTPKLVPEGQVYVHGGATGFDKNLFVPISNIRMHKPNGGFWGSPENAAQPWTGSLIQRDYKPEELIRFTLKPGARVLNIDSMEDVAYLAANYPACSGRSSFEYYGMGNMPIDWQSLAWDYDGIVYNFDKLGNVLDTMDCDSICIFNPHIVQCVNPNQDITQHVVKPSEPLTLYAIEHVDIRDLANPAWVTSNPPYAPNNMHVFTNEELFRQDTKPAKDTTHIGAQRSSWGVAEGATIYQASIMHKIVIPGELARMIRERVKEDEMGYFSTIPIAAEMIKETSVQFYDSTFMPAYHCDSLADAHAYAAEAVQLTQTMLPLWQSISEKEKSLLEWMGGSRSADILYGAQGFASRGFQPGDPNWQKPLCEMAQQVAASELPVDSKLHIAHAMNELVKCVEGGAIPRAALFRFRIVCDEMANAGRSNDMPQITELAAKWNQQIKDNPEEFMPEEPNAFEK